MVTAEQLDQIIKEMMEFEKANIGLKCGPEFADIAKHLVQSKSFRQAVVAITVLTALTGSSILPVEKLLGMDNLEEREKEIMMSSPLKEPLASMFFIGYKAGILDSQGKKLEELMKASES